MKLTQKCNLLSAKNKISKCFKIPRFIKSKLKIYLSTYNINV